MEVLVALWIVVIIAMCCAPLIILFDNEGFKTYLLPRDCECSCNNREESKK